MDVTAIWKIVFPVSFAQTASMGTASLTSWMMCTGCVGRSFCYLFGSGEPFDHDGT